MSNFKLKENLPKHAQEQIDAVLAKPVYMRNPEEVDFLLALSPYLVNSVISKNKDGLITLASGNDLPTGDTGFIKGALFIKLNASGNGLYINTADEDGATWDLADSATSENIVDGAVTTDKIADNIDLTTKNVGIAEILEGAVVNSAKATGTITGDGVNDVSDGDTITVGNVEYTFKATLSTFPAVANEVKIGADADTTLGNLVAAINAAAGAGTTYGTGTVANPDISASAVSSHVITLTAKVYGEDGNSLALATDASELTLSDTVLAGGVDGTISAAGTIKSDGSNLYICTEYSATDGSTWKESALSELA